MLPADADRFLERLLAAHAAEDAFDVGSEEGVVPEASANAGPQVSSDLGPQPPSNGGNEPQDPAPETDEEAILGLLGQAERLVGLAAVRAQAAAAA